ncbi:MAG: glycosyltransferase [Lachnospiraceae bacterium]|nr:glycosyltransferase [Lachnospiraceae bacterium]
MDKALPKLYLIMDNYPFGDEESSFVAPEIPFLLGKFDVTILSLSVSDTLTNDVDERIKLYHFDRKAPFVMKLLDSLSYFINPECKRERKEVKQDKELKKIRSLESLFFYNDARRFKRFIKKNGIIDPSEKAIVYSYWYSFGTYAALQLFCKNDNIKVISRCHRCDLYDEGQQGQRQLFKPYMNSLIDRIIFIAEHGRKYFIDRYSAEYEGIKDKCLLYRLGVEREFPLNKDEAKDGVFTLVSCARVSERKRVDLIAEALGLLEADDLKGKEKIRWIHFGDGPEFEKLKDIAKKRLDTKPFIEYDFKGNVKPDVVTRYYSENHADAYITTSSSEGCPVAMQEAIAYGIPVIGTDVADIPYMIDGNGILISENPSPEEVRDSILKIMDSDKASTDKMRARSEEIWNESFNAQKNHSEFTSFLRELVEA